MIDYTPTQRRNGGLKRAATARRHPAYGIFLPNQDIEGLTNLFPTTYQHGRDGGRALYERYGRDHMREIGKRGAAARRIKATR